VSGAALQDLGSFDLVVVGAGVAGLAAVRAASRRRPGAAIALVTAAPVGTGGASVWAQGGVAAAVGEGDTPAQHAADTLAVAGGLADPSAVAQLTEEGRREVLALAAQGVRFDRTAAGALALGREAAHGRHRIVHAQGDATGAELVRALGVAVARLPNLRVIVGHATRIRTVASGKGAVVAGLELALGERADGGLARLVAPAVVLATGGCGQLWLATTNPRGARGRGIALAARAGAWLADLEMVQFHPTALAVDADPRPLLSEAIRGEGAVIVDQRGRRFLVDEHPLCELAPRDLVARAVYRRVAAGEPVFLDAREALGERFATRFPSVFAACLEHGLDPRRELLPITPAAHYHMGGVLVDADGKSSLCGLWAAGEVASTGVHGANRLASNSLLEGLVWGARAGRDAVDHDPARGWSFGLRQEVVAGPPDARLGAAENALGPAPAPVAGSGKARPRGGGRIDRGPAGGPSSNSGVDQAPVPPEPSLASLRTLLWQAAGVERDGAALAGALATLAAWQATLSGAPSEGAVTADDLLVARLVVAAAAVRTESRGAHQRRDFRATDERWAERLVFALDGEGAPRQVGRLTPEAIRAHDAATTTGRRAAPARPEPSREPVHDPLAALEVAVEIAR
jgi:L-aspartate oxidase